MSRSLLRAADGVVGKPECLLVPDHYQCFALSGSRFAPVRSIKGGFAASFLMSRPPLLFEEGSSATRPFKAGVPDACSKGYRTLSDVRENDTKQPNKSLPEIGEMRNDWYSRP